MNFFHFKFDIQAPPLNSNDSSLIFASFTKCYSFVVVYNVPIQFLFTRFHFQFFIVTSNFRVDLAKINYKYMISTCYVHWLARYLVVLTITRIFTSLKSSRSITRTATDAIIDASQNIFRKFRTIILFKKCKCLNGNQESEGLCLYILHVLWNPWISSNCLSIFFQYRETTICINSTI